MKIRSTTSRSNEDNFHVPPEYMEERKIPVQKILKSSSLTYIFLQQRLSLRRKREFLFSQVLVFPQRSGHELRSYYSREREKGRMTSGTEGQFLISREQISWKVPPIQNGWHSLCIVASWKQENAKIQGKCHTRQQRFMIPVKPNPLN